MTDKMTYDEVIDTLKTEFGLDGLRFSISEEFQGQPDDLLKEGRKVLQQIKDGDFEMVDPPHTGIPPRPLI